MAGCPSSGRSSLRIEHIKDLYSFITIGNLKLGERIGKGLKYYVVIDAGGAVVGFYTTRAEALKVIKNIENLAESLKRRINLK